MTLSKEEFEEKVQELAFEHEMGNRDEIIEAGIKQLILDLIGEDEVSVKYGSVYGDVRNELRKELRSIVEGK